MEEKLAEYRRLKGSQFSKAKSEAKLVQRKEEFHLLDYVPFSLLITKIMKRIMATPTAQRIAEKLRRLSK